MSKILEFTDPTLSLIMQPKLKMNPQFDRIFTTFTKEKQIIFFIFYFFNFKIKQKLILRLSFSQMCTAAHAKTKKIKSIFFIHSMVLWLIRILLNRCSHVGIIPERRDIFRLVREVGCAGISVCYKCSMLQQLSSSEEVEQVPKYKLVAVSLVNGQILYCNSNQNKMCAYNFLYLNQ